MKQLELVLTITKSVLGGKHYDLQTVTPAKDMQGFHRWQLLHIIFTSDKFVLLADIRDAIKKHIKYKYYKDLRTGNKLSNKQMTAMSLPRIMQNNHKIIT